MLRNCRVIFFFKPDHSFTLRSKHSVFNSFLFPEYVMHPCKAKGKIIRGNDRGFRRYRPYRFTMVPNFLQLIISQVNTGIKNP